MNCSYCDKKIAPRLTTYGWWYKCNDCDASVGCHPNTQTPLGTLAKPQLRQLRKEAHHYFDGLWRGKIKRDNCSKKEARGKAYVWLQKQLSLPARDCHIGMFNEEQCKQVINLCKQFYED